MHVAHHWLVSSCSNQCYAFMLKIFQYFSFSCHLCHLHHTFILQSPRINFLWSDKANNPHLSWRWPLWRYRSSQDISAGHGRCYGDNPSKFRNDVIVLGTKIVLSSVKPIGNEKEWWASHHGVVYKLNLISNLSRISDWSTHSRSYFFHSTGTFLVSTDSPLRR